MAQAKKKQSTKTAKKSTAKRSSGQPTSARSKSCKRTQCSTRDRNHIYFITAMSMIAAILLCANVVMVMV